MSLALEVGYQAAEYWDSVDLIQGEALTTRIVDIETNDFSFKGPYINLTFHV